MSWTYRLEYVDCGKAKCRKLHGPYWYAYRWEPAAKGKRTRATGRTTKRYVGKAPKTSGPGAWEDRAGWQRARDEYMKAAREQWERTRAETKARNVDVRPGDYDAIGAHLTDDFETLKAKYRDAIRRAHPDRGGSNEHAVRVNLAWERLQRAHAPVRKAAAT